MESKLEAWAHFLKNGLTALQADKQMTRGAILRDWVLKNQLEKNLNLTQELETRLLKFGQFIDLFPESIDTVRLTGTDMYVGLKGSTIPETAGSSSSKTFSASRLRRDIYDAFTRIDRVYVYEKSSDAFTESTQLALNDQYVSVPQVTIESLIAERRAYAEQLGNESAKAELLSSLNGPIMILGKFQKALITHGLSRDWHEYKMRLLLTTIRTWASSNEIEFGHEWIDRGSKGSGSTPQQLLSFIARHMSDEEVRNLQLPFRAIEEMMKKIGRS